MISRKHLMNTLIVVLITAGNLSAQKTLDVSPAYQRTPVWCWVTVGEMVFKYYGVANINPAGDFQCGIIALINPICNQNCYNCPVPAGSRERMFNMLTQYPAFASRVSNSSTKITIQPLNRPLTLAGLKSEIDAGRPVVAGISPSGNQATGISQHVALIVGYNKDALIINDPYPYGIAAFSRNRYERAGGREIRSGQFNIAYSAFVNDLRWRESIFQINCFGKDCENNSNGIVSSESEAKNEKLTQSSRELDFEPAVTLSIKEAKKFFVALRGEETSREKTEFPGAITTFTNYNSETKIKGWNSAQISLAEDVTDGKTVSKKANFQTDYTTKSVEEALREYQKYPAKLKSLLPQWYVEKEWEGFISLREFKDDRPAAYLSLAMGVFKINDGRAQVLLDIGYSEIYSENLPPNSAVSKDQNKPQAVASSSGSILVQTNSEPAGAEIWVDGKFVGSTPSSIKLSIRTHTIKITRPSYKEWIREIVITEGETKTITAILERIP